MSVVLKLRNFQGDPKISDAGRFFLNSCLYIQIKGVIVQMESL
jgi:hypothetical protein